MNEDCLKLTAYFAERDRVGQQFLGDALLAICERHAFQASVMLRGAEGFGPHHVLQTDRLLSLSEDLPAVLTAVGTRARIEKALPDIIAIDNHGLVTLERARMLTGSVRGVALPEELHDATKLTIYCGRHERVRGRPAYIAIVDLLRRCGALSATVLLGVDGTSHGTRERARFVARNQHVPLMIVAVAPGAQISETLPEIATLLERPLITLERVRICKTNGERIDEPQQIPSTDPTGLATWMMLTIYADQSTHHGSHSLHSAIIHRLRQVDASGASVLLGIWGFHGNRSPRGDKLLALRRHVPTTTIIVDTPNRVLRAFEIVDELTDEAGVVTSELVPAFRARPSSGPTGGLDLAEKHA
jgi:PII-like signaling protein